VSSNRWYVKNVSFLLLCVSSFDYCRLEFSGIAIADAGRREFTCDSTDRRWTTRAESDRDGNTPAAWFAAVYGAIALGSSLSGMRNDNIMVTLRSRAVRRKLASERRRMPVSDDQLHRRIGAGGRRRVGQDATARLVGRRDVGNDCDAGGCDSRLGLAGNPVIE
jgi:hypothetical protein